MNARLHSFFLPRYINFFTIYQKFSFDDFNSDLNIQVTQTIEKYQLKYVKYLMHFISLHSATEYIVILCKCFLLLLLFFEQNTSKKLATSWQLFAEGDNFIKEI